jgi:cyclohexanone monooxygenase
MHARLPQPFRHYRTGQPPALINMLPSMDQCVEWVAGCIGCLRDQGISRMAPRSEAEESRGVHVRDVGADK